EQVAQRRQLEGQSAHAQCLEDGVIQATDACLRDAVGQRREPAMANTRPSASKRLRTGDGSSLASRATGILARPGSTRSASRTAPAGRLMTKRARQSKTVVR